MFLDSIPVGRHPPGEVNVLIEVPLGGDPVKYEFDKNAGLLVVDRFLSTPMRYPGNYGFVPHTLSGDGDPCDVIVAGSPAVLPGTLMSCKVVSTIPRRAPELIPGRAVDGAELTKRSPKREGSHASAGNDLCSSGRQRQHQRAVNRLHRGVPCLHADMHVLRRCLRRRGRSDGASPVHKAQSRLRRRLQHHRSARVAPGRVQSRGPADDDRGVRADLPDLRRRVREARRAPCALQGMRRRMPPL